MATRPDLDTLQLLRRLRLAGIDFVVVGGLATIVHGGAVITEDLDICAALSHETNVRIVEALQDLHPVFRMRPDLGPVKPDSHHLQLLKNLYLWTDAGQLDVLGELPEVCSYAELVPRSTLINFQGVECRVVDIDTLIAAKRAAGRDKDLIAIRHLEAVKKDREQNPGLFE